MASPDRTQSPRWPFWLLLAAWVCANSPQVATYVVLTWMAEARTFSHQQRLTVDVAHLLSGEKAPGIMAQVRNETPAIPLPPVPPDAVLKKSPLSVELTADVMPPALRASRPFESRCICPESLRAPPLHEPPRGVVV